MNKRKEVYPIHQKNKQFSNAQGQVAEQNFLDPCANREKSMHSIKKFKSLSKVSFCDDNLIWFDKGDTKTSVFPKC